MHHCEETSTVSGIQGTGLGMAINVSHMVQEIAMELLSNAGFSVSLADDGDVAVETLRTAAPDPHAGRRHCQYSDHRHDGKCV